MGNLTVKTRTLTTSYEYENETVKVKGSFNRDADNGSVTGINGNVELKADGTPIGSFSGYINDQRHAYNQHDVPIEHLNAFKSAVQEIDQAVTSPSNQEGGGEQ